MKAFCLDVGSFPVDSMTNLYFNVLQKKKKNSKKPFMKDCKKRKKSIHIWPVMYGFSDVKGYVDETGFHAWTLSICAIRLNFPSRFLNIVFHKECTTTELLKNWIDWKIKRRKKPGRNKCKFPVTDARQTQIKRRDRFLENLRILLVRAL